MKRVLTLTLFAFAALSVWAQSLNVGSYNIRMHSKVDYKNGDGWTSRRDIMCDLVAFTAFDIFGAQEVCHDQLEDMLQRLPEYNYIGVARDDGKTKGEYSPIFYRSDRFELLDSGTFWLSETPNEVSYGWDAACRRVCSWGHFKDKLTKKKFWFFNTHMDHKGKTARTEGAKLVIEKIKQMCGKDAKVILTGDFNVAQNSPAYNTFAQSGIIKDAYDLAPIKYAPAGTFNSFKVGNHSQKRIDHIFVAGCNVKRYGILTYHYWSDNEGAESNLTDAPKEISAQHRGVHLPSDHYPVQIFVEF
ncbi:MAG: endonuclease/exonuclease/phosphatase family protein [Alistipes sp.]|nr:endonuclease/exonuclease/phosphatase family protein [Alistipes sp.]